MPTTQPKQPVTSTADERSTVAGGTRRDSLVDLSELTDSVPAPASAAPTVSDEERQQQEQRVAQATKQAAADLVTVRSQLVAHPTEQAGVGTATVPTEAVLSGAEAGLNAPPPALPPVEAPTPSTETGSQSATTPATPSDASDSQSGAPDARDAVVDAEVRKRGLTKEGVTIDQMLELVRQSVYPHRQEVTTVNQSAVKPATDGDDPQPDATATLLQGPASSIEADIAERQHDADQPVAPTKDVEQPTESQAQAVESNPVASAEAAS